MEIKNIFGEVIFKDDSKTMKETVRNAVLSQANLFRANLFQAEIEFYNFPSIRTISSIRLNNLPDNLTLELMRRDALAHPHPGLFDEWAKGGDCPYKNEEAFWLFEPKKKLWKAGKPQLADRDLILEICKSQNWWIRNYLPMPEKLKNKK